ncbi:MAG: YggT family protein [Candidatus Gracilibacteria bacterium]|nr:YggT family protein [Candidatus Gracilibacteria bacterium]MDQ7022696.1 YggT family protein [Candidatus Gracilibacteria bacterium]
MTIFFSIIVIILIILKYILVLDIIFSWLTLLGINFRPKFISDIMEPIYKKIKSTIPTSIGPIDFAPIIIIFIIIILITFLLPLTGDNLNILIKINNYFL